MDSEKATREKIAYDTGSIKRGGYESLFSCSLEYHNYTNNIIKNFFSTSDSKRTLEIGSNAWIGYVHQNNIRPQKLFCINISRKEIEIGREYVKKNNLEWEIYFIICDANMLPFKKQSFGLVFGGAILHHLSFNTALKGISEVCTTKGKIFFYEPLGNNPIGKIIRFFTPFARTKDEMPLTRHNLKVANQFFDCHNQVTQFTSVLGQFITNLLKLKSSNLLTVICFSIDEKIKSLLPFLRYYYRDVMIIGTKNQN